MRLSNGTVIPSGLLGLDQRSGIAGFNKTYNNFALRAGIVVKSYGISDKKNISKLVPEYDVVVIEQDGDRAITPITYKNCVSSTSFGSIADFFEAKLRSQKKVKDKKTKGKDFSGQDGAIVLILCLDGSSEKAIIIGALPHPDKKSKLIGDKKILAGEFNGISIEIDDDGAATLSFKGSTDHEGKAEDPTQGTTTIDIEKDGSLQFKNLGVTQRLDKIGDYSLTNLGSTTIDSMKQIAINTKMSLSVESLLSSSFKSMNMVMEAQGTASVKAQSFDITGNVKLDLKSKMVTVKADAMIKMQSTLITMDGQVFLGGAGGQPLVLPTTMFLGIGNLGAPVLSLGIGPFATKAFAV